MNLELTMREGRQRGDGLAHSPKAPDLRHVLPESFSQFQDVHRDSRPSLRPSKWTSSPGDSSSPIATLTLDDWRNPRGPLASA